MRDISNIINVYEVTCQTSYILQAYAMWDPAMGVPLNNILKGICKAKILNI
jgi:hypothetical protein